jgi:hypothetical protein
MTSRPVIFISAVSVELHSARELVAKTLHFLGYDADWQGVFDAGQGDLRGSHCRRIDASAGVVQIVGQCYGCEPTKPDDAFGRVSYTQFEALYACQRGKKVWYLLLDDAFPADAHEPEPGELTRLQAAYRGQLRTGDHLWHPAADTRGVEITVLRLRDELTRLRRRSRQYAALVLTLLAVLVLGGAGLHYAMHRQSGDLAKLAEQNAKLLAALRDLPATLGNQARAQSPQDEATRLAAAYAELEKKNALPPGSLEKELPKFAEQLLRRADTSALDRANALFATKKFAEAEAAFVQAKDKALAAAGKPVQDAIRALEGAGNAAREQIHYAKALDHFRAAATLTDEKRGDDEWSRVQHSIAVVLYDDGKYHEAELILHRVIEVRQRILGPEHPETLGSRNNLAAALQFQGRNAEAEQENRAVIAIRERVFGAEHPDTLGSRNNLAAALRAQGRNAEAEQEHRAVIAIRERVLGAEHPDTLSSRNNLALALDAQGRNAEAEQELRAVLALRERVQGAEHPATLGSRVNLGSTLWSQAKYAEAEKAYRETAEIYARVLGAEHPDTLASSMGLANVLQAQGRNAEAEQEHRAVLAIRERVLGAEHPDTLSSRMNLANALQAQGRNAEAEQECRAVLAMRQRVLGAEHPDTLTSQNNLANALQVQGRIAEAELQHRVVLALRERVLGAEHPDVFQSCYNLAGCLKAQKKLKEALAFMQRAEAGCTKVLGSEHPYSKLAKRGREHIEADLAEQNSDENQKK